MCFYDFDYKSEYNSSFRGKNTKLISFESQDIFKYLLKCKFVFLAKLYSEDLLDDRYISESIDTHFYIPFYIHTGNNLLKIREFWYIPKNHFFYLSPTGLFFKIENIDFITKIK